MPWCPWSVEPELIFLWCHARQYDINKNSKCVEKRKCHYIKKASYYNKIKTKSLYPQCLPIPMSHCCQFLQCHLHQIISSQQKLSFSYRVQLLHLPRILWQCVCVQCVHMLKILDTDWNRDKNPSDRLYFCFTDSFQRIFPSPPL